MTAGQKPIQGHQCWTPNCRRLAKDFAECVKAAIAKCCTRIGYLHKFRGQIKKADFSKVSLFSVFGWVIISPLRSLRRSLRRLSGLRQG